MPHPLRFGVYYDFRNPPGSGMTTADLYRRTLDQIRTVDQLGYDSVWIAPVTAEGEPTCTSRPRGDRSRCAPTKARE